MFTIYSKPNCTFCEQAKNLLKSKNLAYEEKIIDIGQTKVEGKTYVTVQELKTVLPTAVSVPQIFQEDKHIGGFRELQQVLGGA